MIGANDVVNPDARNNPGSPIYGMPILNVDQSQAVVVLKRSMAPGFAGIDNPLFVDPKTVMLFGDAKESVAKLAAGVKSAVTGVPVFTGRRRRAGGLAGPRGRGGARRVRRPRPRRVDDAAEGLRHELSGRRLPRDAGARRRAMRCSSG